MLEESDALEEISQDLLEDLYVNFDNLAMKVRVSDSNVVCNWFVMLACLATTVDDPRMVNINLYLMNKMVEKYEKLVYYFDEEGNKPIQVARDLTTAEDKSLSLGKTLRALHTRLGSNNRAKHFVMCLIEKRPLGKKYIGMDLRAFLKLV